jgi:hypothetical protein
MKTWNKPIHPPFLSLDIKLAKEYSIADIKEINAYK